MDGSYFPSLDIEAGIELGAASNPMDKPEKETKQQKQAKVKEA